MKKICARNVRTASITSYVLISDMGTERTNVGALKRRRGRMTEGQRRADDFLKVIKNASGTLRDMAMKVEYLKYKAAGGGSIRYDKDHVQTTPEDLLSKAMAEAVDLERKILDRKNEITEMRIKANRILYSWDDTEGLMLAYVLIAYYLDNRSMQETALKIDRSERQTYRMKLDALERFSKEFVE